MFTIFTYTVPVQDRVSVDMPRLAEILHIGEQVPGTLAVWARVKSDVSRAKRQFRIAGTGHELTPREATYPHLATVQCASGLVWHIFDAGEV